MSWTPSSRTSRSSRRWRIRRSTRTRSPAPSPTAGAGAFATIWRCGGRPPPPRARCSSRPRRTSGACRSRAWTPKRAPWFIGPRDGGCSMGSSWTRRRRFPSRRTRRSRPPTSSATSARSSSGGTRRTRSPAAASTAWMCRCRGCSSARSSAARCSAARCRASTQRPPRRSRVSRTWSRCRTASPWPPPQNPGGTQATAARLTGLPAEKVIVNTTMLGGGFGRRGEIDFIVDAVETSKAVGAPVKVMWTREDDITHGFYRPATYNVFRAALDANGMPSAWFTRIVGPGILIQKGRAQAGTIDPAAVEAVRNMPYDIPNLRIEWNNKDLGIPLGFWRSVGPSQNGFIIESFIDELAHAAGKDPFEYRRALLGKSPRHKAILELVANRANWGSPVPAGRGRGIAVVFSYGSYAATVAEVSVAPAGAVKVHRLVCGIDAGLAVNPDAVKAQMEGGAVYALTAAFYGQITIDRGRVQQSNFHDYQMLRINEMPVVDVHILDSGEAPGGLGEPGVPTVAPAVCNAIFAATGRRVRKLPIDRSELKRA